MGIRKVDLVKIMTHKQNVKQQNPQSVDYDMDKKSKPFA